MSWFSIFNFRDNLISFVGQIDAGTPQHHSEGVLSRTEFRCAQIAVLHFVHHEDDSSALTLGGDKIASDHGGSLYELHEGAIAASRLSICEIINGFTSPQATWIRYFDPVCVNVDGDRLALKIRMIFPMHHCVGDGFTQNFGRNFQFIFSSDAFDE